MYVSVAKKRDPPANQWDNLVFGFLAIETHITHFISVKSVNEEIEFSLFGIPVLPRPPYTDKNRRDISLSIIIKKHDFGSRKRTTNKDFKDNLCLICMMKQICFDLND